MANYEILIILGMMAVTFGVRYPTLAAFGRIPLPPGVLRSLRYVPPAVLAAIIAPAMLMPNGVQLEFDLSNPYLMGGVVAFLVAWKFRNLLATILIGMLVFWGWTFLITVLR